MQACCDVAFSYAHVREQFGTKIGEFQVNLYILHLCLEHKLIWGHNGRDCIMVRFTTTYQSVPITTYPRSNHAQARCTRYNIM